MRVGGRLVCDECEESIDASGPGVTNDWEGTPHWQPCLEDLRSDPDEHRHPKCFADVRGVEALIDAVHQYDLRRKGT
jgi:hypothetical protein